jgi:hypothetical protein
MPAIRLMILYPSFSKYQEQFRYDYALGWLGNWRKVQIEPKTEGTLTYTESLCTTNLMTTCTQTLSPGASGLIRLGRVIDIDREIA